MIAVRDVAQSSSGTDRAAASAFVALGTPWSREFSRRDVCASFAILGVVLPHLRWAGDFKKIQCIRYLTIAGNSAKPSRHRLARKKAAAPG